MATKDQDGVVRFVEKAYAILDEVTYYRILNLDQRASGRDVRAAYYRIAARLHPDLYGRSIDPEFKLRLTAVYSRVVEAYKVLTDDRRRNLYDKQLGKGNVRLTADAEARPQRNRPEDQIRNPGAKKFFKLGEAAIGVGDKKTAVTNYKLALSLEPGSTVIEQALARAAEK